MNNFGNAVANIFTPQGLVSFIEFLIFGVMVIYTFLAFMLTRQLNLMNRSFKTPVAPYFKVIAFVHFLGAVLLTFITFFVI